MALRFRPPQPPENVVAKRQEKQEASSSFPRDRRHNFPKGELKKEKRGREEAYLLLFAEAPVALTINCQIPLLLPFSPPLKGPILIPEMGT